MFPKTNIDIFGCKTLSPFWMMWSIYHIHYNVDVFQELLSFYQKYMFPSYHKNPKLSLQKSLDNSKASTFFKFCIRNKTIKIPLSNQRLISVIQAQGKTEPMIPFSNQKLIFQNILLLKQDCDRRIFPSNQLLGETGKSVQK